MRNYGMKKRKLEQYFFFFYQRENENIYYIFTTYTPTIVWRTLNELLLVLTQIKSAHTQWVII